VLVPDSTTRALHPVTGLGERGEVCVYVCGITPYDATHLGHAATYLLFDTMLRACRDAGQTVRLVQNVTDVDDPLLERALQTGEDWTALAERETQLFREDMAALRIVPPEAYVGAVESIPEIVETVQRLIAGGAAYDLDGDVYFSVASSPHFGDVSRLDAAEMLALFGERGGDPDRPGKKDPLDPLLWRAARPGEPSWESSLGRGRPGWHVECATIALSRLGPVLDVQGGGEDLLFPHHEMSAAHAAAVTGVWPFAAAHVHQALVGYAGEKMSKSRGNLVFVSTLRAAGADPMAIRLALLAHSSREPWEWHDEELPAAAARLGQWRSGVLARPAGPPAAGLLAEVRSALRNGLDTPAALDAVDAWVATEGADPVAPRHTAAIIDALLGIVL
jgi:L-cysteine:1D-myo-inositol 2-amino-2-deoxy-alpha-D-glucopyranoside ligase